jgi:hypothetical protein
VEPVLYALAVTTLASVGQGKFALPDETECAPDGGCGFVLRVQERDFWASVVRLQREASLPPYNK